MMTINRTILELKYADSVYGIPAFWTINRTILELKSIFYFCIVRIYNIY